MLKGVPLPLKEKLRLNVPAKTPKIKLVLVKVTQSSFNKYPVKLDGSAQTSQAIQVL